MDKLNELLTAMKIKGKVVQVQEGLRTRRYFVKLRIGEKVSKIKSISDEISLAIESLTRPKIYVDTSSKCVIIETTFNEDPMNVYLEDVIQSTDFSKYTLPLALGRTMEGENLILDLSTAPHILVGGTTGSGKSILTKTMIESLLYKHPSAKDLQLAFIDPKGTELIQYKRSSHCGMYATKIEDVQSLLEQTISIMETRYELMAKRFCTQFADYRVHSKDPHIVLVVDELADILIQDKKKKLTNLFIRLLQKSRAAGIHVIANTQRPSAKLIDGNLKANLPVQIALKTSSQIDSRIIIGVEGAENLVGRGDMLVNYEGKIVRAQAAM